MSHVSVRCSDRMPALNRVEELSKGSIKFIAAAEE